MTIAQFLLVLACLLFVVAALVAGGVITGVSAFAFAFGGAAAFALARAV